MSFQCLPAGSSFNESAGRDRRLLRASSTALNLLSHVAPLATSLTLIKLFGRNTRVSFSLTLKSFPCYRAERYGCHRFGVAQLLAKKSICSEGRHTKGFCSILNSIPETLPQMLKTHAAKDGASPATRRAKSERLSGILSFSLFLVRGRVSIETHAFFHLTKKAVFRPVVSRSAMSNKWIRESDDLL